MSTTIKTSKRRKNPHHVANNVPRSRKRKINNGLKCFRDESIQAKD